MNTSIHFVQEDLEQFAAASHDRNPLHLSSQYSRRSSFGEPVVFGVLGFLAALGAALADPQRVLEKITITFRGPLFAGIKYGVTSEEKKPGQMKISVDDAGTVCMAASLSLGQGKPSEWPRAPWRASAPRKESARRAPEDFAEEKTASGTYAPERSAFTDLGERHRLSGVLSATQLAALLWSSYLVGMEMPGERAIFSRLEITFAPAALSGAPVFDYAAKVLAFDERFDLLEVSANLTREGEPIAAAKLDSFVRRDTPELDLVAMSAALPRSTALAGKAALVVGGSRGLGAALVAGLVSQGCNVLVNYRTGAAEANALKERLSQEPGSIHAVAADASVAEGCQLLRDELVSRFGGLDVLVANAVPPLRAISFSLRTIDRIRTFVDRSLALATTPLAACLDLLKARAGLAALISSQAAAPTSESYPSDWVHYVAAKSAAEGLVRSLAAQTPSVRFLIVRPPALLTDLTNTPHGRQHARAVEGVAARIVQQIRDTSLPLSLLENF